jgi:TolB-like protein/Tfp pilus assembly protein PilF
LSLVAELRRRNVFKVTVAYVALGWVVTQVTATVAPLLHLPEWIAPVVLWIGVIGFPFVVAFAWLFGRAPEGMPREGEGDRIADSVSVAAPAAVAADHSIAVLPFVNMSSDKEQDYFSDGLSEELLNLLAQLPQLRVIARTSSFSFKGKEADVATVARALNVSNVLEGSVRKSGDTLRITAQLVRASDSSHLWSQTYDRKMTDVFQVQDDIAGAVVAALKVRLLPAQQLTNPRRTSNTEAYNAYLLGNQFHNRGNLDGFNRAAAAYRRAVALDPEFAAAYAGLAIAGGLSAEYEATAAEIAAAKQRALAAAERSVTLAPDLADGYTARGWLRSVFYYEWAQGKADFEKARLLDPGNCTAQHYYARLMGSFGRLAEAIAAHENATQLDPLSAWAWMYLGREYISNGQFQEAREALNRALTVSPEFTAANYNVGILEMLEGRASEAVLPFQRAGGMWSQAGAAMAEHSLGHPRESQRALDELIAQNAHDASYQVAQVYAWRGERDNAFEWLERAYAARDGGINRIKIDPLLVSLRTDPRFAAMVTKIGLPQ